MERVQGGAGHAARRAAQLYGAVRAGETDVARLRGRGEPRRVLGLLEFAGQGRREERGAYLRRLAASPDAAAMVRPWLGPAERGHLDVAGGWAPAVPPLLVKLPRGTEDERRYALEALAVKRPMEATGPLFGLLAALAPDEPSWYPELIEDTVSRIVIGGQPTSWRRTPRTDPVLPGACVPMLLRQACQAVPRVRRLALTLLGCGHDPAHLGLFTAAAGDPDRGVASAALVALGRLDDSTARDHLAAVLTEPSRSLDEREIAAVMLGRAGDRRAFETLVLLLNHRDGIRNASAAEALARLGDPRTARAAATLATNRLRIAYALAAVRLLGRMRAPESLPALTSTLTWLLDEDRTAQQAAAGCVEELGRLGDARAVPVLTRAAGDPRLRAAAVDSLGRIGGPDVLGVLLGVASDEDGDVRAAAARGLARYEDEPRATAALAGLCALPYPRRIVRALVRSGDPAAAPVLAAVRDGAPSAATRRLAGRFRPDPSRTAAP
ncbi:HEAT repeat domain-containing protein [Actinacidiphila glaucinigra]|uniref:HEAT repeat n=1 Tax=Actinacidiphila glaucinigra TaxID=235986 RepID=A0A239BNA0_9ACTN|nr:HEAT repeat [Actinacidiphila glaucinigra]